MPDNAQTVKGILDAYRKDCQRTDDFAEGGMHLSQEQTMRQLYELVLEIIGPTENSEGNKPHGDVRNQLRASQRHSAAKAFNQGVK